MHLDDALVFLGRDLNLETHRHSTVESISAMLDKYGFERAVACSFSARTEAIERDHAVVFDAARRDPRLVPCPVVVPDSAGEVGDETEFVDDLIARGARAACLYPKTMGTSLDDRVVGGLLRAMEARRLPLYLFDASTPEAVAVALRHPRLPVIVYQMPYRDRVWIQAMHDTPNLYVLLAPNFCPWRGIERLVAEGAAERMLLASSFPVAEPGAPVAMAFGADISDEDLARIASGNLRRLIADVDGPDVPEPAEAKPTWQAEGLTATVAERRPLDLDGVIDVHGHLGNSHRFAIQGATGDTIVREMDRAGVEKIVLSHEICMSWDAGWGNDQVLEAMRDHPGRIYGYACTYAGDVPSGTRSQAALDEIKRCIDAGMVGIKLHTGDGVAYADERYAPVWEYAEANGLPVLVHTWGQMADIGKALERCPTAPVILGHAGAGAQGVAPYIDFARRHENTWLDITFSGAPWLCVEKFVESVGAHRVLFGSDATWFSLSQHLGRVLFADISNDDKRAILVDNARAIFSSL